MSKIAEQAAKEIYKDGIKLVGRRDKNGNLIIHPEIMVGILRNACQRGYEQAEKDLALTWEDMVLLRTLFDATDANQSMGALTVQPMTREYYEYLLREFNEQRKK